MLFAFAAILDYMVVNMAQSDWEADDHGPPDEVKVFNDEGEDENPDRVHHERWMLGWMLEIKNNLLCELAFQLYPSEVCDLLEIPIRGSSLNNLAIDCVARNMPSNDPRLAPGNYPKKLRNEIEACRTRIETEVMVRIANMENGKREKVKQLLFGKYEVATERRGQ